jgi:Trypsin-like peptidase domain
VRSTSIAVIVIAFLVSIVASTRAQVSANVLRRTLEIRVGGQTGITGTAFSLDVDGREYLVTAGHMVKKLKHKDVIEISVRTDKWDPIDVTVYPCEGDVDIAVLIPPRQLTVNYPLEPSSGDKAFVGQDMYFVGFPFGASSFANSAYANHLNGDYPMPIIKKGVYAGNLEHQGRAPVILLDGYNNHGFSGAPIVFHEVNRPIDATTQFYVIGVVSGFVPELVPVVKPDPIKQDEDTSKVESWRLQLADQGKILRDTGQFVPLNAGIVQGYPIRYALEMIRLHPEGPAASQSF